MSTAYGPNARRYIESLPDFTLDPSIIPPAARVKVLGGPQDGGTIALPPEVSRWTTLELVAVDREPPRGPTAFEVYRTTYEIVRLWGKRYAVYPRREER